VAGHAVTILGKDEAKTRAVAEELGCKYVIADVTDYNSLKAAFEQAGHIDVLINNAGIWIQGPLEANDPARLRQTIEVNALGPIYCSQLVVPQMKERRSGRIINVISQAGLKAQTERAPYNSSKWAVTGFTKSMQLELKPFGISMTGFYPGALNNNAMFDKAGNSRDMSKGLDLEIAADALVYICGLPDHVDVPELGIQSLEY
jgi:NAD(P)-dependent dehydrogenase (short-subunit alcohol dehydrogenase family)